MTITIITYSIDQRDIITDISASWSLFAQDNCWNEGANPNNIIGCSLWDFIQGIAVRHLYERLFYKVRTGASICPIPFRCDAPHSRRFLDMSLKQLPNDIIEVSCAIRHTEPRDPVAMLDINAKRSENILSMCSWCKKIAVAQDVWTDVEEALRRLRLFEADEYPRLSHGICPECFRNTMAELDE